MVWHAPFLESIKTKLMSTANPGGTITNSDLELAATIAQAKVLANITP